MQKLSIPSLIFEHTDDVDLEGDLEGDLDGISINLQVVITNP